MRWKGFWRWIRIVFRIFAAKLIKMIHVHSCSLSRALILLTISALVIGYIPSCSEADRNIPLLDEIKEQGNTDPVGALKRMDSISISMSKETRHNLMRYELLRLRLLDKAGIMPSSDVRGKDIYEYFMSKGSGKEKMEASYYLASTYRDLHDSPRAIRYFQQTLEIAESSNDIDSVMLANTYSQLSALYRIHYDYNSAMEMSEKGLEVARKLDIVDPIYIMDVATIAYALNDTAKTVSVQQEALDMIRREKSENLYQDVLCEILSILSDYGMHEDAEACRLLLNSINEENRPHNYYESMARYYMSREETDSSIACFKLLYDSENTTLEGKFNALLNLALLYKKKGNTGMSNEYALKFIDTEKEYRHMLQHEQAVNAHNEYVYSRNQAEEERIRREAEDSKNRTVFWILAFIILLAFSFSLIIIQRYRVLKRTHHDLLIINKMEKELRKNNDTLQKKEALIHEQKQKIDFSQGRLDSLTAELDDKEKEISLKDTELQAKVKTLHEQDRLLQQMETSLLEKERLLIEKMEQNNTLYGYALTEKIKKTSEQTLEKFTDAAMGKRKLTDNEWKELFSVIEINYPNFRKLILSKIKNPGIDKLRIAYLLKAGMTNSQIVSVTGYASTTVWRKTKYLTEVLGDDLYSL